jgi:HK97 family phage prohead protease
MEFVLSDETPDRIGDIIMSDGWDLRAFARNPVALFGHRSDFIVGRWANLHVEDKALRGHLALAPAGISARIDEIRKLVEAGILKAVSVGFRSVDAEPLDKKNPFSGYRFLKQELIECSLVSIPANPNALAVAKSLQISPQTLDLVFAKHGTKDRIRRRGLVGKHARIPPERKGSAMSLAQRIPTTQARLIEAKDKLAAHWQNTDESNVSDHDLEIGTELNAEIVRLEKQLAAYIESEKLIGASLEDGDTHRQLITTTSLVKSRVNGANGSNGVGVNGTGDVVAPAVIKHRSKEIDPLSLIARAGTVLIAQRMFGCGIDQARERVCRAMGIDVDDLATKIVCDMVHHGATPDMVLRAASAPAITTVAGWAQELVHIIYTDLMPLLLPHAILTRLAARGLALNFGRAGKIVIPTRSRTPALAGSFVGEGQAIPVRQGAFTSQTLTPKKVAVISTWTKEMDEFSIPAIEGIIREAVMLDTGIAIDSVLIDINPATVIRPAGLLNGIVATPSTAGGGLTSILGDLKALIGGLAANTYGNIRDPVWLLNPGEVLAASLAMAPNGLFPFRDEVERGTLNNIPIIDSATIPLHTVALIDAADFVTAGAEGPRLELSDQATLHMEDTAPLDLVAAGSPPVVAAPQRSLFQTDSLALRLVMRLNWVQRRAGTVVWAQNVTWN